MKKKIKAIVFDMGGVLVDLDLQACTAAFLEILGYERITEILDPCHQKGIYGAMEAGEISTETFRAEVLRESRPGCKPEDVDRCMAALLTGIGPDKVELLKRLAEKYPLYILSNNNEISMKRFHEIFDEAGLDWRKLFRKEFISCRMKLLKPSPEIYRKAISEVGEKAEDILFIDDSPVNVQAARAEGMQARYYEPGSSLPALLADLGGNL